MRNHPNATMAGGTGGAAAAVVIVLEQAGVSVSAEAAAVIVAVVPTVFLLIGREGLVGLGRRVLFGRRTVR
jgi:hypothetical protein